MIPMFKSFFGPLFQIGWLSCLQPTSGIATSWAISEEVWRNSMTGSERPSPEPLLKKRRPQPYWGRENSGNALEPSYLEL